MKIVVVGCGKIGATIIESLVIEGHDVTLIDKEPSVVNDAVELYDCMGISGSGADCATLSDSGVADCDLFISVTGSDEFNMLSCFMAKRLGAKQTIARIRNPEYNDQDLVFLRRELGLSMVINPEMLAAREIFNTLQLPSAAKIEPFSRRSFEMIELKIREGSPIDGMSLIEMRKQYKQKFLICAVRRDDEVVIPDGNFVLKSGDHIGITASPSEIQKLFKKLGLAQKKARTIMILGASRTAYYLSKMLLDSGSAVKVIDPSAERCAEFCETLPDAVIIKGDATQQEILLEEGISSADAFAALTGIDEENILLSLFATTQSVPKVVAKITRDEFSNLASQIGIESIVSPRRTIANVLVGYARGLQNSMGSKMETLYKIMDGKAEALEFNIKQENELTGVPLKNISLKQNILIAGIIRNRRPFIPSGEDSIAVGDLVIVLAAGHRINDITDIIK